MSSLFELGDILLDTRDGEVGIYTGSDTLNDGAQEARCYMLPLYISPQIRDGSELMRKSRLRVTRISPRALIKVGINIFNDILDVEQVREIIVAKIEEIEDEDEECTYDR